MRYAMGKNTSTDRAITGVSFSESGKISGGTAGNTEIVSLAAVHTTTTLYTV